MKPGPDFDRQCDEAVRGFIRWLLAGILVLVILGLSVSTVLEQTGRL